MTNLIAPIPHPDEQRTYAALRSEFRALALARIRDSYTGSHPLGWAMTGDPLYARDRYTAEEWSYILDRRLCDPVTQDFGLDAAPSTLGDELEELAQRAVLHDSVTWDDSVHGVTDHDAPPCAPVNTMTDDDICDYVDHAIKESDRD